MIDNENQKSNMKTFGLLGKNISYSFSSGYFSEKFKDLNLDNYAYVNFDIDSIEKFPKLLKDYSGKINGMNVTIPYKQEVLSLVDELDDEAATIGAVNTIKFLENGKTKGFNTDVYGFENSLRPLLKPQHTKALIFGTGGASKAVAFALKKLQIDFHFVSRKPSLSNQIAYSDLNAAIISEHTILINCTPLGTFPEVSLSPDIPYQELTSAHLLYDLIYNPSVTAFLQKGKDKGAEIKNGLEMLQLQAEKSWQIWNR
jgi:shikimate dehydrogenase